jgi:methionyl-tRNA formyltransferase
MTALAIDQELLAAWWKTLQDSNSDILQDWRAPLEHTAQAAAFFDLPILPRQPLPANNPAQPPETSLAGIQPSFKALTPEILHSLRQLLFQADQPGIVQDWAEKLMRYCEIFLPGLQDRTLKKCGSSLPARLLMLQLAAFLLDASFFYKDVRFLNTVLKLLDLRWLVNLRLIRGQLEQRGEIALAAAFQVRLFMMSEYALVQAAGAHPPLSQFSSSEKTETLRKQKNRRLENRRRIVIFSPSQYSLYTLSVAEMLRRQEVQVAAIFTRQLLSPQRFLSEYSRDGKRLLQKIWKKLVLRRRAYIPQEYETIASFMQQQGISFKNVSQLQKQYAIPVVYCKDLNDPVVVQGLEKIKPDLVVFTGGGLIRKDVLARSGLGVINCHMGVLPGYRGRDVVEWPLLQSRFDCVGLTVHFMDEGVDTGDILRIQRTFPRPGESRAQLRERLEGMMCSLIVDTCLGILTGQIQRQPQEPGEGKQYFFMHPRLIAIAEAKLK